MAKNKFNIVICIRYMVFNINNMHGVCINVYILSVYQIKVILLAYSIFYTFTER